MPQDLDWLDGRLGEAWAGDVPNGSHINLAIGRRGSPTAAAIIGQAGNTAPGHLPVYVCVGGAGNLVRPVTVFRNKVTIDDLDSKFALITWGAAQLGVGQGVLDAVADGLLAPEQIDEIVLARGRLGRPGRARRDGGPPRQPRGHARLDRRRRRRLPRGRSCVHAADPRDGKERVLLR